MGKIEWQSVRHPAKLLENVKDLISRHPELGYMSVQDFIRDATREKLERLRSFRPPVVMMEKRRKK